MVGAQLQHARRRRRVAAGIPGLDPRAVVAAGLECQQRRHFQVGGRVDRAMARTRDHHQLFLEGRNGRQPRLGKRLGDKGAIDFEARQRIECLPRRQRDQLQLYLGPRLMVRRQHIGQPAGGGAFHRGDAQAAAGTCRQHGLARFLGQLQDAAGVVEQGLSRRRQHHAPAIAHEQLDTERLLQLADAGGDVGLHPVQPLGRAGDAAGFDDGTEDFKCGKVHGHGLLNVNPIPISIKDALHLDNSFLGMVCTA
ncbi:hypothetical protein D9M72_343980 [compost metagenome]